jgi:hypothetical protein
MLPILANLGAAALVGVALFGNTPAPLHSQIAKKRKKPEEEAEVEKNTITHLKTATARRTGPTRRKWASMGAGNTYQGKWNGTHAE